MNVVRLVSLFEILITDALLTNGMRSKVTLKIVRCSIALFYLAQEENEFQEEYK